MKLLNLKYRKINKVTTVLTFNNEYFSEIYMCINFIKKKHHKSYDLNNQILSYFTHSMCNCYYDYFIKNNINIENIYFNIIEKFNIKYKE